MTDTKRTASKYDELIVDGVPLGPKNSFDLDPRIVRRYHAFEPGGSVREAMEALRGLIVSYEACLRTMKIPETTLQPTFTQARAALARLEKEAGE